MENKEKIEKLQLSIDKIDNKQNKIMFYLPSVPQASGGVGVVYSHAKRLHDLGYDVIILHDEKDYAKPTWLGSEYCDLKHLLTSSKPQIFPEDILVYPEGFSNIMQQTASLTCIKVVLCQSHAYVLPSLVTAMNWSSFGIKNVLVVQEPLKEYIHKVFGAHLFDVKVLAPSIDENIFKPSGKIKKPIVAVSARDQSHLMNLAKHFYTTYPQYKMVSFKDMRDLSRKDFASVLDEAFLGVWIDRVAGFGTFPIECAKVNTPFIALVPDMIPEYAHEDRGVWVSSQLDLADVVAKFVASWLEDKVPVELMAGIGELATQYSKVDEDKGIEEIYSGYLNTRKSEIEKMIKTINEKEQDGE